MCRGRGSRVKIKKMKQEATESDNSLRGKAVDVKQEEDKPDIMV